jgi:hypothetical protein
VVKGVAAAIGGADEDIHLLGDLRLAHVVGKTLRTYGAVKHLILPGTPGRDQSIGFNHGGVLARMWHQPAAGLPAIRVTV